MHRFDRKTDRPRECCTPKQVDIVERACDQRRPLDEMHPGGRNERAALWLVGLDRRSPDIDADRHKRGGQAVHLIAGGSANGGQRLGELGFGAVERVADLRKDRPCRSISQRDALARLRLCQEFADWILWRFRSKHSRAARPLRSQRTAASTAGCSGAAATSPTATSTPDSAGASDNLVERGLAALDQILLLKQPRELLLHALGLHGMPAGQAVELGAERGDPLLVGVLHRHLARHGRADQIVAIDEIGRRADIGRQQQHEKADTPSPRRPGESPASVLLAPRLNVTDQDGRRAE